MASRKFTLPTHKPGMKHHSNRGGTAAKKKTGKKKGKKKVSKKKATKRCKPCKPGTTRRAAPKAKKSKSASHGHKTVRAVDILKNVAVKRGKRWTCGGPVRSGCGGSGSRVIGKVR